MNKYPYSRIEAVLLLAIILLIWGLGAYLQQWSETACILFGIGAALLVPSYYFRYIKE